MHFPIHFLWHWQRDSFNDQSFLGRWSFPLFTSLHQFSNHILYTDTLLSAFALVLERIINLTVIVKKSSPKNLSADCRPTVDRQSADSWPTVGRQVFWGALLHNYQFNYQSFLGWRSFLLFTSWSYWMIQQYYKREKLDFSHS